MTIPEGVAMSDSVVFGPGCSQGMVLQRDERAVVWGWSTPGRLLRFEVAGHPSTAQASAEGRWTAVWTGLPAGGPYALTLDGQPLFELWVGDLWLCAGQSNMERSLGAGGSWPTDALAFPQDPGIRQLCLPNQFSFDQECHQIPGAHWIGADSPDIVRFSAVGYAFARDMRERTGVPQGLVVTAVGGSTVQSWLSQRALEAFPRYQDEADRFAQPGWLGALQKHEEGRRNAWYTTLEAQDPKDPKRAGTGSWRPLTFPGFWKDGEIGDRAGSLWIRTTVVLKAPVGAGRLALGTLVDADDVWVNGTWVGATAYQYPSRRYVVAQEILREGLNEVLVRLVAPRRGGGATPDKDRYLEVDGVRLGLGPWEWRDGAEMDELPTDTFLPLISRGLHNGLLTPLAPMGFRAVLWYQGESNLGEPGEYARLFDALRTDWRRLFDRPDLVFLVVQLPLFGAPQTYSGNDGWAGVRDDQRRVAEAPGSGLVIGLDAGEWNDIHPSDKTVIGHRLALAARRWVFQEAVAPWTGPLFAGSQTEGAIVRVRFNQGEGLSTRDGKEPGGFLLAGDDGVYHPARAVLEGSEVVLESPAVPGPQSVRYAWASNPAGANLVNSIGIPASPFEATVVRIRSFP